MVYLGRKIILKTPYFILVVIVLFLIAGSVGLGVLEKTVNESIGEGPHTEIMLWQSPGYSSNLQLFFFGTEVHPSPEKIIVKYKIENKSDEAITIRKNLIDVGVVKADLNTIGDPGTLIWRWSQKHNEIEIEESIELARGEIYQQDIVIDRNNLDIEFQYYINTYYNGELVAQYKIIDGIYNK